MFGIFPSDLIKSKNCKHLKNNSISFCCPFSYYMYRVDASFKLLQLFYQFQSLLNIKKKSINFVISKEDSGNLFSK